MKMREHINNLMIGMMWLNLNINKTIAKIGKKNNNEIVDDVGKLEYNNNKCYKCVCVIEFHEHIVNDLSFVYRENWWIRNCSKNFLEPSHRV